ncbi:hypothetical protein M514_12481 [Trichuris suis]|uniref:Reverse transcriptase domain-containing protein n=1 Tax=Trichuris suis TaxID=68888 RepID=A0A085MWC1_9BILA|nr:hypothetical protein M514_12481 [Trichuris suis]
MVAVARNALRTDFSSCHRRSAVRRSRRERIATDQDIDKVVTNLSSTTLTSVEKCVPSKGLNFVPTPKIPPFLDVIASTEMSLTKTEPRKAAEIKGIISSCLLQTNKFENPNLNSMEKAVIKKLKTKEDLVATKTDKGNVVVLLDKSHYVDKMVTLLSSTIYSPIQSDPTPQTRTELRGLLQIFAEQSKEEAITSIRNRLYYVSNSVCPQLYGPPKIHKPDVPLRPVVCSVNSVTSQLCAYLKSIIQPLARQRGSHVSSHKDFCVALKSIRISKTDFMVSYDVKDLFTSIPITHTLTILQSLLDSGSSLSQRTKLSPFHIEGFFRQNNGAPMGSPLSPVLAEAFMEHLEETAFESADIPVAPILFKRYVDDVFAIVKKGQEDTLLEYLHTIFPGQIAFTIEKEVNNELPFLDVLVRRKGTGLRTTVYRKPTHSDREMVIQEASSHPPPHEDYTLPETGIIVGWVQARSLARNDKIRIPFEDRPGVVYQIKCACNASYIGETGSTLLDRFNDHMKALNGYKSAQEELNGTRRKRRGRP